MGLFDDAPIIHYTRAQALADGVLVDASEIAKEAGFKVPVAISEAAWRDCVEWTAEDSKRQTHQDQAGRLWDVVWMGARGAPRSGDRGTFQLYRVKRDGRSRDATLVTLAIHIGPGDAGEPVITIMLPGED